MIDRSRDATASVAIATRGLLLDQSPYRRPFRDQETSKKGKRGRRPSKRHRTPIDGMAG